MKGRRRILKSLMMHPCVNRSNTIKTPLSKIHQLKLEVSFARAASHRLCWPSASVVEGGRATVAFVKPWDIPKSDPLTEYSVASERTLSMERWDSHKHNGVLRFGLWPQRDPQGTRLKSVNADVPTSICSVWTVWATNEYDPIVERGDSHEHDGILGLAWG
jgi:hypothetical protein